MEAKTSVESLNEVFRCFICMEKPKDARICPHCSKLCCCSCIVRWLSEQRPSCPHCRASLFMRDLVNLRWAEDVSHHLDSLQSQVHQFSPDREAMCRVHPDEKQNIYCSDCDACICHKCALFTGRHVSHKFRELDDVYQEHVRIVKTEIRGLKMYLAELTDAMCSVDQNASNVREGREEAFQRMHQAWVIVCERLDADFKERLQALKDRRNDLDNHKGAVETLLQEIECQVSSLGRTELIRTSSSLRKRVQKARERDVSFANSISVLTDFANEIMPSFESSGIQDKFKIDNFSAACMSGKPVYSNPVNFYGIQWRLKVYPNGSEMVRGQYVSVFLELVAGPREPSKYEYKIEMTHLLSSDLAMSVGRKFVSTFEVGECWGYNRFFKLDCLEPEGFKIGDTVEFQYSVRHASYYYMCRDMGWYVEQLESDKERYRERLKQLQKAVSEAGGLVSAAELPCTAAVTVCRSTHLSVVTTASQPTDPDHSLCPLAEACTLPEQLSSPCEQDAEQIRAPDPKLRCSNGVAESDSHFDRHSLPDDFACNYSPPLSHGGIPPAEPSSESQDPLTNYPLDLDDWSGSDGSGSGSGSESDSDQSDGPDHTNPPVYEVSDVSDEVYELHDEQEPHQFDEATSDYEAEYYTTGHETSQSVPQPSDRSVSPDAYDGHPGLQSSIAAALARCNRSSLPPFQQQIPTIQWRRQLRPDRQHMVCRVDYQSGNDAPCADGQSSLSLPCVYAPLTDHDMVESETPSAHEVASQ